MPSSLQAVEWRERESCGVRTHNKAMRAMRKPYTSTMKQSMAQWTRPLLFLLPAVDGWG